MTQTEVDKNENEKNENEKNENGKNENDKKKKSKLPFIITIIIILLLFSIGAIIAYNVITKVDPDLIILDIINENVKADADNSRDGYFNAKNVGYELDILTLSKPSRVILWDSKNDCYALYDGETLVSSPAENPSSGTDMWLFVDTVPSESPFSVYWAGTNKVTVHEDLEEGKAIDIDHFYYKHLYTVTTSGSSITYTCTEDGCGYCYTVKTK